MSYTSPCAPSAKTVSWISVPTRIGWTPDTPMDTKSGAGPAPPPPPLRQSLLGERAGGEVHVFGCQQPEQLLVGACRALPWIGGDPWRPLTSAPSSTHRCAERSVHGTAL